MGKKHKKHHKSEKRSLEEQDDIRGYPETEKPLKLVLKVGGADSPAVDSPYSEDGGSSKKHKHKKKKKKKSSDRDKERHSKHDDEERPREKRKYEEVEPEVEEVEETKFEPKEEIELPPSASPSPPPPTPPPQAPAPVVEPAPVQDSPFKKPSLEDDLFSSHRTPRDRQGPVERTPLINCLDYLQRTLQRKDTNGFFSFPVTDQIAPGYSSIVTSPMDFSTMRNKIDSGEYTCVTEYKKHFKLMCDNCILYNGEETIFNKEAKKLLVSGLRIMGKDNLLKLKKNLSFMAHVSESELGLFDEEVLQIEGMTLPPGVSTPAPKVPAAKPKPKKPKTSKTEAIPDNMSPDEILEQVEAAADEAREKLLEKQPKSQLGFLKRAKDGTTTLNLFNYENTGIISEQERVVTLGALTGKLTSGAGNIAGFKEDKRNKATPVSYLNYGPFSSYAPMYDSSFAMVSKDDSDLLLTTYGDELGVQYAKSIKNFVNDAGDYAQRMVDNLLDILTNGEHSKAQRILDQKRKEEEEKLRAEEERKKQEEEKKRAEEEAVEKARQLVDMQAEQSEREAQGQMEVDEDNSIANPNVDFNSLRELSTFGIDMSFLDSFEKEETQVLQEKLDETSGLLKDLEKTQHERLSRKVPAHLSLIPGPSKEECELAEKVTEKLTDLAKQANPGGVASVEGVRKAMGISPMELQEEEQSAESQEAAQAAAGLEVDLDEFFGSLDDKPSQVSADHT